MQSTVSDSIFFFFFAKNTKPIEIWVQLCEVNEKVVMTGNVWDVGD